VRTTLACPLLALLPALPAIAGSLDLRDSTEFVWELSLALTLEVSSPDPTGGPPGPPTTLTYAGTLEIPATLDSGFAEVTSLDPSRARLDHLFVRDELYTVLRFRLRDPSGTPSSAVDWRIDWLDYSFDPDGLDLDGDNPTDQSRFADTSARWRVLEPPPLALLQEKRAQGIPLRRVVAQQLRLSDDHSTLTASNGTSISPAPVPVPPSRYRFSATARFDSITFSVPEARSSGLLALVLGVLGVTRRTVGSTLGGLRLRRAGPRLSL
jgi:hypothetical protein